jgi:ABC-type lipoprotein export system ATPase subunit
MDDIDRLRHRIQTNKTSGPVSEGEFEMPGTRIIVGSKISRTPRVMQIEGLFDVQPSDRSEQAWEVNLPLDEHEWNVGLIVGPSGCGKSTIANRLFGRYICNGFDWPTNKSILDGFPEMPIKEITELLSSVGFSSPPLWLRPFRVLSTGQQMRVNAARLLAENKSLAVMDEFSSVVDRTVARIGSAAIAKTVRRRNQKFIAVTCHADVADWLQPDWIYQPELNQFGWRLLQRRPAINLVIRRVHRSAWELFKRYHYLDTRLNHSAQCFAGFYADIPVVFTAILHMPYPGIQFKREHRTVCLPDYQGIGIGNAMSDYIASMCRGLGVRYLSQTVNPAMIAARKKSPNWSLIGFRNVGSPAMSKKGYLNAEQRKSGGLSHRLISSFEFVGKPMRRNEAEKLYAG